MKQSLKKGAALLMGISCLLTGCGNMQNNKSKVAMGRYVEEKIEFSENENESMPECLFFENQEGNVEVLAFKRGEEDRQKSYQFYVPDQEGKWQETDTKLVEAIADKNFTSVNSILKDKQSGENYLVGIKEEPKPEEGTPEMNYYIEKIKEDHTLEEMPIDWQCKDTYYGKIMIDQDQLYVLPLYCDEENTEVEIIQQYDLKTGKLVKKIGEGIHDFTILEDRIYATSMENENSIACYDLAAGQLISNRDIGVNSRASELLPAEDGKGIYIINSEGIYYLPDEEEMPEQIIEGKRYTMSTPSAYIRNAYLHNGVFYVQYAIDQNYVCKQYVYHKELPTVPEKTLTIFLIESCPLLQSAARAYADQHPEVCVEVNVVQKGHEPIEEETKKQAIEAISTKILAGEAPDIMVLDGLPIDQYIEKGILGDMSPVLGEIEKNGNYYDSLMRTYEKDQKVYALPLSFTLLSAAGKSELVKDGFSLEKLAAYQKQHPEEKVLGNTMPGALLEEMSGIWNSKILDSEGKVNPEALTTFLESIHTLAPMDQEMDNCYEWKDHYQPARTWQAINKEIGTTLEEVDEAESLQLLLHSKTQLENGMIAPNIDGETSMVNLKQLIGINAKTDKKEEIQELLNIVYSKESAEKMIGEFSMEQDVNEEVILGEQIQKSPDSVDNYPIKQWGISFGVSNAVGGMDIKEYNVWYTDEAKYYIDALKNAKAIKPMDEQVLEIIKRNAEPYFMGKISVDEAVEKAKEKVDIYLSEQNK